MRHSLFRAISSLSAFLLFASTVFSATDTATPAPGIPLADASAQIRAAIRATAKKSPDPALAQHVETLLAKPAAPAPPADSLHASLEIFSVPKLSLQFNASWAMGVGFYNGGPEGIELELRTLEPKLAQNPDDFTLAYRAEYFAEQLSNDPRVKKFHDHALALARKNIAAHPDIALAHAQLAQVLNWDDGSRAETSAEIHRALTLDPHCLLAHIDLLNGEIDRLVYYLGPDDAPPLEQEVSATQVLAYYHKLYDSPPDAARLAAFDAHTSQLLQPIQDACAADPTASAPRFALLTYQSMFAMYRDIGRSLQRNKPATFDAFYNQEKGYPSQRTQRALMAFASNFDSLIKLQPCPPETICVLAILRMSLPGSLAPASGNPSSALPAEFVTALRLLAPMTRSPDTDLQSRACTASGLLHEFNQEMRASGAEARALHYSPESADFAVHALSIDTTSVTALDSLAGQAFNAGDLPAARALTEIRRSVIDDVPSVYNCAGAEAKLAHWTESRQFLEEVLKRDPSNLDAKIDLVGVSLHEKPTQDTLNTFSASMQEFQGIMTAHPGTTTSDQTEGIFRFFIGSLAFLGDFPHAREGFDDAVKAGALTSATQKSILQSLDKAAALQAK